MRAPARRDKSDILQGFFAFLSMVAMAGCAPAAPMMLGGSTTPRDRVDVGLGGAVRVPVGDLAPQAIAGENELLAFAEPGGVVPLGFARWGFVENWQAGLTITGATARVEVLGEMPISPFARVIAGVAPYGGYAVSKAGEQVSDGYRLGALAPLAIALSAGGILEAWLGARVGAEHAEGTIVTRPGHLSAFRAGAFVGLGVGFRRVHALLELAADYEYWRGALAGQPVERQGLALTPSFALRIRF